MWDIVSAYCIAIGVLCSNPDKPYAERAMMALTAVKEFAQSPAKEGQRTELIA